MHSVSAWWSSKRVRRRITIALTAVSIALIFAIGWSRLALYHAASPSAKDAAARDGIDRGVASACMTRTNYLLPAQPVAEEEYARAPGNRWGALDCFRSSETGGACADSVLVLSHPKVGRTWLKCLLGQAAVVVSEQQRQELLLEQIRRGTSADAGLLAASQSAAASDPSLEALVRDASARFRFAHGTKTAGPLSHPFGATAADYALPAAADAFEADIGSRALIVIVRDPRDAVVSAFYERTERGSTWAAQIPGYQYAEPPADEAKRAKLMSAYLREPKGALQTQIAFLNVIAEVVRRRRAKAAAWVRADPHALTRGSRPPLTHVVRYEDLVECPSAALGRLVAALSPPLGSSASAVAAAATARPNTPPVAAASSPAPSQLAQRQAAWRHGEVVRRAVERCTFSRMQREADASTDAALAPAAAATAGAAGAGSGGAAVSSAAASAAMSGMARKVRAGRVGGYVFELSEEDVALVEREMDGKLNAPEFGYHTRAQERARPNSPPNARTN